MADTLTEVESNLLKNASKLSQDLHLQAQKFKEMLIARDCISHLESYVEFNQRKELIKAIRLCWQLGYDEKITPNNLSGGKMSTPKRSLQDIL